MFGAFYQPSQELRIKRPLTFLPPPQVSLLLHYGADRHAKDMWGKQPADHAAAWGHDACVKLLLENESMKDAIKEVKKGIAQLRKSNSELNPNNKVATSQLNEKSKPPAVTPPWLETFKTR